MQLSLLHFLPHLPSLQSGSFRGRARLQLQIKTTVDIFETQSKKHRRIRVTGPVSTAPWESWMLHSPPHHVCATLCISFSLMQKARGSQWLGLWVVYSQRILSMD